MFSPSGTTSLWTPQIGRVETGLHPAVVNRKVRGEPDLACCAHAGTMSSIIRAAAHTASASPLRHRLSQRARSRTHPPRLTAPSAVDRTKFAEATGRPAYPGAHLLRRNSKMSQASIRRHRRNPCSLRRLRRSEPFT